MNPTQSVEAHQKDEVGSRSLSSGGKPTTNCSETEIFARFSEAGCSRGKC
jgi:hypothetical protein